MFSIIFAENSYWRFEHILFSLLTGAAIYYFYLSLAKFESLRPDVMYALKENKIILTLAMAHFGLQFAYHFIYSFAFVEFVSRLTFIFILIYLNKIYLAYLRTITEDQRTQIEKYLQIFAVVMLFIGFLSILNSKTSNGCGQNLYGLYALAYVCVGAASLANGYSNLKIISTDIKEIFAAAEQADLKTIKAIDEVLTKLAKLKEFFYHFLFASFVSCFIGALIFYLKFKTLSSTVLCKDLFADRGFFFKLFFILLEIAVFNCLNAFIFYHYFWKIRSEFEFKEKLEERATEEAFQNYRSLIIEKEKEEGVEQ